MSRSAILRRQIKHLNERIATNQIKGPHNYAYDPVGYAEQILKVKLWDVQKEILKGLHEPPYRIMVPAGHSVGKTFIAAVAINYWFDSFDPSVCISTAPESRTVKDVLWKEVRVQRMRAGLGDMLPIAPEMRTSPGHYAKGFTATKGESFQGRHDAKMLFVFDEAVGIDPVFWQTCRTMFRPEEGHAWLVIFNPTDTTSEAFFEDNSTQPDGSPRWKTFRLDCLDHPNILDETADPPRKPGIPSAVTKSQVDDWVQTWCDKLRAEDVTANDLEWPPRSGVYYRQGPIFQARCRGMWPEGGTYAIWSDMLWKAASTAWYPPSVTEIPEIGCDVARFGDDYTSFHVRWGNSSHFHESVNGWPTTRVVERLMALADEWAATYQMTRPTSAAKLSHKVIPIKVDDDGVGGGVTDQLQAAGYFVVPIGAGTKSFTGRYPNKRSELWFQVADRARSGLLGLARLPKEIKNRMRQQCMAVEWVPNTMGMRVVEPKEQTKEKIGRSPDDLDALNLAYLQGFDYGAPPTVLPNEKRPTYDAERKPRRKLFG